jgi:hypothetical protein
MLQLLQYCVRVFVDWEEEAIAPATAPARKEKIGIVYM